MTRTLFFEVIPESWENAKQIGRRLEPHIFRGQTDPTMGLTTSLERAASQYNVLPGVLWDRENQILYNFKSRAHLFLQSPPEDEESLEWLALIQHYGGVTRLLDFTESFYIASFFAMESATKDACVWAINRIHLIQKVITDLKVELDSSKNYPYNLDPILDYAKDCIDVPKGQDFVLPIKPHRLNERMAIQKGVFLFLCNLEKSFEHNLCASFKFPFDTLDSNHATPIRAQEIDGSFWARSSVVKICLPRKWHRDALYDLYSMDIDAASLFPGLEGFARSLKIALRALDKF